MPRFTTVVYTGEKEFGHITQPYTITLYKGIPKAIYESFLEYVPSEDFEIFDPEKHRPPEKVKSILIYAPRSLFNFLAISQSLRKLRRFNPYSPLKIVTDERFERFVKDIENVSVCDSFEYVSREYSQEYNCQKSYLSPAFSGGAYKARSLEHSFLLIFDLKEEEEQSHVTLIKNPGKRQYLTILNTGKTLSSAWRDLGYFLKDQKWSIPVQLLDNEKDFDDCVKKIQSSKYVITTGDSDFTYLAGYYGIPVMSFVQNTEKDFAWQMNYFNLIQEKSFILVPWKKDKPLSEIYHKVNPIIESIITGKPQTQPERKPVEING